MKKTISNQTITPLSAGTHLATFSPSRSWKAETGANCFRVCFKAGKTLFETFTDSLDEWSQVKLAQFATFLGINEVDIPDNTPAANQDAAFQKATLDAVIEAVEAQANSKIVGIVTTIQESRDPRFGATPQININAQQMFMTEDEAKAAIAAEENLIRELGI